MRLRFRAPILLSLGLLAGAALAIACSSDPDDGSDNADNGDAAQSGIDSATAIEDAPTGVDGANDDAKTDPGTDAGGEAPGDTKFSFVVMPDTQQEILSDANSAKYFTNRVTWINDNWTKLDIRFTLHTGDAANWGNVDPVQFDRISNAFKAFDQLKHPFAIAPGNHDTAAVCKGGSACPGGNATIDVRNTVEFNKRFPPSRGIGLGGTFEANKSDNAFYTFRAGGVDWMAVTLELWPRTVVVDWAKTVVAAHPKHNVIFATHMHLNGDGSIGTDNGGYGANSPKYVFDNLYSKYENVRFVFSGHVGASAYKESTGDKGNKIFQLLNCFHSNVDNPVRIVEVDTAANSFSTKVYAPSANKDYAGASYTGSAANWVKP